eukprot:2869133-Rhodomonas_salina.2
MVDGLCCERSKVPASASPGTWDQKRKTGRNSDRLWYSGNASILRALHRCLGPRGENVPDDEVRQTKQAWDMPPKRPKPRMMMMMMPDDDGVCIDRQG